MSSPESDKIFAGSIPKLYETYLVPLIFRPYAEDLANRLASRPLSRVLEIAAGTGVVTRHLASVLPEDVAIVATDLNRPMLDMAAGIGTSRPVAWRQADAMQLPFEEAQFDAVVCQFGVMFFPDKPKVFSEARRVLRPGGVLLFNVWDRIEENEFAHTVTTALESLFPQDPPRFLARTPHGYHDLARVERRSSARWPCLAPTRPYRCRAKYGGVSAHPRDRLLPGDAPAQRDRGARRVPAWRSNRPRSRSDRRTVRPRSRRQQDPGTRCHSRTLSVTTWA